jgi:hypothetical protein
MEPEGLSPGSHELSLSWDRSVWSTPTPWFIEGQFILLFYLHQGIPSGLVPAGIPTKTPYASLHYTCCMCCPSHSSWFDPLDNDGEYIRWSPPNIFYFCHLLPHPFRPKYLLQCVYRMRMQFVGSKDGIEIDGLLAIELVLWKNIIYKVEIIRSCISTEGFTLKQLIASLSNYVALNG